MGIATPVSYTHLDVYKRQTLGSHSDNWLDVLGLTLIKSSVLLFLLFRFGKNALNFWFELVAKQRSRELFVLNVLMVTLLMAAATNFVGLSYALGAFVAGMLLSLIHI